MDTEIKKLKDLIDCTQFALNNDRTKLWNKNGIFSNCTYLRYLTVLYWIQLNPISKDIHLLQC